MRMRMLVTAAKRYAASTSLHAKPFSMRKAAWVEIVALILVVLSGIAPGEA